MLALAEYEAGVGPCGYHHSLTTDKRNVFGPKTLPRCPVCAFVDQEGRRHHAQDTKARDRQPKDSHGNPLNPGAPLPSDGRQTYMQLFSSADADAYLEKNPRG